MSLTARLTIRMSVLVSKQVRPVCFMLSVDAFQMHAMTDTLAATEMNTQIDSNAMNNSSVTDMDDVIPQLLTKGTITHLFECGW